MDYRLMKSTSVLATIALCLISSTTALNQNPLIFARAIQPEGLESCGNIEQCNKRCDSGLLPGIEDNTGFFVCKLQKPPPAGKYVLGKCTGLPGQQQRNLCINLVAGKPCGSGDEYTCLFEAQRRTEVMGTIGVVQFPKSCERAGGKPSWVVDKDSDYENAFEASGCAACVAADGQKFSYPFPPC